MSTLIALLIIMSPAHPAAPKPFERCPKYERLIRQHGLPVRMFSYIMYRESRCLPRVIGKNAPGVPSDYGLLQINGSWKTITARICRTPYGDLKPLLTPACNVKVAAYLWRNGGTNHWRGSSGAFKRG